jgi:asparagine synthase (glutamine-hydrolysing)
LGGLAIPEGGHAALAGVGLEFVPGAENGLAGGAGEDVRAFVDSDRAFGILAEGQTGDPEGGGFLLDAAGVGEDNRGARHQVEEIEIAKGFTDAEAAGGGVLRFECLKALAGAGMDGEIERIDLGNFIEGFEDAAQLGGIVDVGGAVEGDEAERGIGNAESGPDGGSGASPLEVGEQGVDHQVADHPDGGFRDAFAEKVGPAGGFGDEEEVSDRVRDEAVDLLRHGSVARAETSLDMDDGDLHLLGDDRSGEGGVDIADDEDGAGVFLFDDGFEAAHNLGGLLGVGAGAGFEVVVGRRNIEFAEEGAGHPVVVVLPGMDQDDAEIGVCAEGADKRREFHEIGAGAADANDGNGHGFPVYRGSRAGQVMMEGDRLQIMCGIAGYLNRGGRPAELAWLRRMTDRLEHRGPDGAGVYLDGPVALGHRRLSIIDVEGGHQPLGNEDGRIQVVFNGEIYNYLDLWADLEKRGHRFRTRCDTEVLVHLYEEVGERLPEYLNGMFAFAIWDGRKQELFVARDRLGKKPVYYTAAAGDCAFAFASELKALLVLEGLDRRVRRESVAEFLAFSYVPEPETILEGVKKLPAGSSLTVRADGTLAPARRYWQLGFEAGEERPLGAAMEELDALARDAVERRLMSDVPLGAFLSGGVDSSAVVAYMSECARGEVKTFSIGFDVAAFDETEYARKIVGRYGTDHYERVVTPDIGAILPAFVEQFDEPFGDASAIPTLYLSQMTRERVTVALSGDGADEVFGGYRRYRFGVAEERARGYLPGRWGRAMAGRIGDLYPKFDYLPRVFRAKTTLQNLALDLGGAYYTTMTVFRDAGLQAVLGPEYLGHDPRPGYEARFQRFAHLPPLKQLQAVDVETYLPGDILVKADRATMAFSLESRSPWLDYRVAEMAAKMPSSWLLKGLQGKWVFKKMLEPRVPEEILYRPKMGFSAPLAEWFRGPLGPFLEHLLCEEADLVEVGEVRRLLGQHRSGLHEHSRKLWNVFVLLLWWRRHARGLEIDPLPAGNH